MKFVKAKLFIIIIVLLLSISGPVSKAAEQTETGMSDSNLPDAVIPPSVVAHFHLTGVLNESPVFDTLSLTGGQVTSLRSLVQLMERASNDDELKAVILTFDGMSLDFGQLEEVRDSINRLKAAGKKVFVHAEEIDTGPILFHVFPQAEAMDPFLVGMKAVQSAQKALIHFLSSGELQKIKPVKQDSNLRLRHATNEDFSEEVALEYLNRLPSPEEIKKAMELRDMRKFINPLIL